jgi:DNA-binding response OmpR family regulator
VKSGKKSNKNSVILPVQKNYRILVVEDESIIALDLQNILQNFGFEVCCVVSSGEESIHAANQSSPDVILMDVKLKGAMNGIEAAKEIHKSLNIPVIYLTAFGDESTVRDALTHRDFAYIRKPFEEREIEMAVRKTLQRSSRDKANAMGH